MRILFLNPGGSALGGAERSLALLITGLVGRGHEVYVKLLTPGDASDLFSDAGATIVDTEPAAVLDRVRMHSSSLSFLLHVGESAPDVVRVALRIRRLARELRPDIIHSNGFRSHVLAPLLRPGGPPHVWSVRDVAAGPMPRAALRLSSRAAAAIAVNSAATAVQLAGRPGVQVIHNPIAGFGSLPDRLGARVTLGLPADRPVIAIIAHMHQKKGHHVAIESIGCWPRGSRPLLAVAGASIYTGESEPYVARLRRLISERELERDVVLLGGVEDVRHVYAAADVAVHPAVHPEGFGRAVVESQLAGLPVVATRLGAVAEFIEDGVTGVLVPPSDPLALHRAIDTLFRDPIAARALGERARSAAARFSPEYHVRAIEALYRRVMTKA